MILCDARCLLGLLGAGLVGLVGAGPQLAWAQMLERRLLAGPQGEPFGRCALVEVLEPEDF